MTYWIWINILRKKCHLHSLNKAYSSLLRTKYLKIFAKQQHFQWTQMFGRDFDDFWLNSRRTSFLKFSLISHSQWNFAKMIEIAVNSSTKKDVNGIYEAVWNTFWGIFAEKLFEKRIVKMIFLNENSTTDTDSARWCGRWWTKNQTHHTVRMYCVLWSNVVEFYVQFLIICV